MHTSSINITSDRNFFIRLVLDKKLRWFRHAVFNAIGMVFAFNGQTGRLRETFSDQRQVVRALWLYDIFLFIVIMAVLYFLMFYLIPKFLFKSRIVLFAVSFIGSIFIIYACSLLLDVYLLQPHFPDSKWMPHPTLAFNDLLANGLVLAILLGCVTGYQVSVKWLRDTKQMNELQQASLRLELEQLKSQVNPHFLFNTLNNLLVLTKTNTDKAVQVLLGLSDLLRYQLYDSAREKILLSKDVEFIRNLLALEQIRKDDFEYEVQTTGSINGITIPPFLFIPFVENAIKHGASNVGHCYLKLRFGVTDTTLVFTSENSKSPAKHIVEGGLGLKNIKRRLELLYPQKHTLQIEEDSLKYNITLIIPI